MPGSARLAAVVFAISLGGCLIEPPSSGDDTYDPPPGGDGGWGSGWGGGGGTTGYGCHADSECGTQVCARNGDCMPASAVHVVHVNWTVGDEPASDASCASAPKLGITFSSGTGDEFGFAPVPCKAGRYTIDKMPTRINNVQLARQYEYGGGAYGSFDATGNVLLDLPY